MSDLMEWLMIVFVTYILIAVWVISKMLDRILEMLSDMVEEMERMEKRNNGY